MALADLRRVMRAGKGGHLERLILESLRRDLEANARLSAAGLFGSFQRGDTWTHSDIDVFVTTGEDTDRWEDAYLRRQGFLIHCQVLSRASLRKVLAKNHGSPFFAALSEVTPWFDRTGELASAIASARTFSAPATSRRACRESCEAVAELHQAEKHAVAGRQDDARRALTQALSRLAAAELAYSGIYPPREIWHHQAVRRLPEYVDLHAAWAGQPVLALVQKSWIRVRARIAERMWPVLEIVRARGSLSLAALQEDELLADVTVSERLIAELVACGLLTEEHAPNELFGEELVLACPPAGARQVAE